MKPVRLLDKYYDIVIEALNTAPTLEERYERIKEINEEFYGEAGETLPNHLLTLLGTWCLKETYEDKRTNKVALEEFPILSQSQLIRRNMKMVCIPVEENLDTLNYHLRNNSSTSRYDNELQKGIGEEDV